MFLAISVLFISLVSALSLFKSLNSSWMSFVLILTFSSGMMTLFMYTASMTANEYNKTKKTKGLLLLILIILISTPPISMNTTNNSMKSFTNSLTLMIMATILISTMVALSIHGHHPNQTLSSSF